jgi:hypothetical protein
MEVHLKHALVFSSYFFSRCGVEKICFAFHITEVCIHLGII